jgi:subtilisin family serine protease
MSSLFPNRNSVRTRFWRRRGQTRQIRAALSGGQYRLEQLEPRHLLTATSLDYDTVSADWFETIAEPTFSVESSSGSSATDWVGGFSDDSGSTNSKPNGWIVRLSPSVLQTVSQVTDAIGLFSSASGLRVLGGLGLPGQLLLESSACSSEISSYLEGLGAVSSFEPDLPISVSTFSATSMPNDPRYGDLYGLNNTGQSGGTPNADIDAPEAWHVTTGSRDVIVAVVDTGIDYNHPDLAANMWVNPGEIAGNGVDDDGNGFVDDVHGYDFVNNDGDPFDDQGHGTHCAGTIGGVGNNGTGVVGVNW